MAVYKDKLVSFMVDVRDRHLDLLQNCIHWRKNNKEGFWAKTARHTKFIRELGEFLREPETKKWLILNDGENMTIFFEFYFGDGFLGQSPEQQPALVAPTIQAPLLFGPAPPPEGMASCPYDTCGAPVKVGAKRCPSCLEELIWDWD